MSRLIQYIKDTRSELNHVNWPSRQEAIVFTTIVIVISLGTAGYLGFFDWLFTTALKNFLA
jgi:preprotein translocase SecE subunit